jgi:hypothetical protein
MTAPVITPCLEADSTVHSTDRFWPFTALGERQKTTHSCRSAAAEFGEYLPVRAGRNLSDQSSRLLFGNFFVRINKLLLIQQLISNEVEQGQ